MGKVQLQLLSVAPDTNTVLKEKQSSFEIKLNH